MESDLGIAIPSQYSHQHNVSILDNIRGIKMGVLARDG